MAEHQYPFQSVTIGGTFHAMHIGHRRYIEIAFGIGWFVHISLTSDSYARKRKTYDLKPVEIRQTQLVNFLSSDLYANRFQIRVIDSDDDVIEYLKAVDVSAAVVEPAYFSMFLKINQMRADLNKEEMCLVLKPRTKLLDQRELSSTLLER